MSLKIIDNSPKPDEFLNDDGTSSKSKGGTERVRNVLLERIKPELIEPFKIIHSRVRDSMFEEGKRHILLNHDTYDDPESRHLQNRSSIDRFERIGFVSNYQQTTFQFAYGLKPSDCIVMKNAIDPVDLTQTKKDDEEIRLIYHTTPHRGLDIVVAVFEALAEKYHNIHLDVFSSFSIYGWEQRDQPYQKIFDKCKEHPRITYHGVQPNEVVIDALKKAHIFAYPNIWPETSCIAMLEALSAGCSIVCPNHAALPETTGNFALMYPYHEDPRQHANMFYHATAMAIEHLRTPDMQTKLVLQKTWVDSFYNWDLRIAEWEGLLGALLSQKN